MAARARARVVAAMSSRSSSSVLLAVAMAALLVALASAQSGCTSALIGLYPCMNYISGSGTAPSKSCCSQLASVVQSQPQCLCSALSGDSSSLGGVTINKTRALELPSACSVQTPPVSKCNGAGGGSAPDAGANTPTTPAVQTPAGTGSKTTPSAYLQGSGGSSLHGSAGLVLALAAALVYVVLAV